MAHRLELDELVEHFTLLPAEVELLGDRSGGSRLGFALLLKYFTLLGRFPTGRPELAEEAVGFVACQVRVPASELLGARQRNADEADRRGLTPLF
jgi:hypothetical protein